MDIYQSFLIANVAADLQLKSGALLRCKRCRSEPSVVLDMVVSSVVATLWEVCVIVPQCAFSVCVTASMEACLFI